MKQISEQTLTEYLIAQQETFYRFAYSYVKNREDALDAVQTTVCKAIEKQASLRSTEALPMWTRRILVNVCLDILRRRHREIVVDEVLDTEGQEDTYHCENSLMDEVNALPVEVSTIIKLRFFEDLSLKEISAVTGENLNTVKTRLYSGLKKLRISMEGDKESCVM